MVKSFIYDSMTEYPLMKMYPRVKQKFASNSKAANNFIDSETEVIFE